MIRIVLLCLLLSAFNNLNAQEWQTNFDTAKQLAKKTNNPIILVFQGSDWCAPCMKLDKEIWDTNTFKAYAEEHYVMLLADFPRKKKNALESEQQQHNNQLAERYNKKGFFPLVVVLNTKGEVLGEIGYKKTDVDSYIKSINSFIQ